MEFFESKTQLFDSSALDRRGYNIGIRLIDEFLAKSKTGKCIDFRDTADKIAKVGPQSAYILTWHTCLAPVLTWLTCLDMILQVGFKMFLNTSAAVANWNAESTECSLVSPHHLDHENLAKPELQIQEEVSMLFVGVQILEDNPLTDFVELPENYSGLIYCNVLCGVIRGALEMVGAQFP